MNKKNKKLLMVCGVLMSLAVALHVFTSFLDNDTLTDESTLTTENEIQKVPAPSDDLIEIVVDPIILPDGTIVNPPETSEQPTENDVIADKNDFVVPQIEIPQISIDKAQNIVNNSNETYSEDGLTVYQEMQPTPTMPDGSTNSETSTNNNNSNTSTESNTNNSTDYTIGSSTNETTQEIPYNGHINEDGDIYMMGFGYIPMGDGNIQNNADDMWQNGNKVGIM